MRTTRETFVPRSVHTLDLALISKGEGVGERLLL